MILYGLKHCDTVRKARKHLDSEGVDYRFVDFDENAPEEALLRRWMQAVPIETLFNTRSTTYRELGLKNRKLSEDEKIALMTKHNRLIKRPVLETKKEVIVGYNPHRYNELIEKG
jgi:arsenate reductase